MIAPFFNRDTPNMGETVVFIPVVYCIILRQSDARGEIHGQENRGFAVNFAIRCRNILGDICHIPEPCLNAYSPLIDHFCYVEI